MTSGQVTILLCDGAAQARGKWSLIGVFTHVLAQKLPARIGLFWMHVSIGDFIVGEGTTIRLEIVDNRADESGNMRGAALWSANVNVAPQNEKYVGRPVPFNFAVPVMQVKEGRQLAVEFPGAGDYDVNVLVNDQFAGMSTIRVVELARKSEE